MRHLIDIKNLVQNSLGMTGFLVILALSQVQAQETAAEAKVKVESESIKRVERSLLYNKQLEEGAKLLAAGEVKSARDRYQSVVDATDDEPAFLETHLAARKGAARCLAIQASMEEKDKNYAAARVHLEDAVNLDPGNATYQASLTRVKAQSKNLEEKYPGNKAVTPALEEKIANIQKLMFEGDSFMETGQYQRAIGRYKEVLTIDEFNDNARKRIQKVEKMKYQAASLRRDARREQALYDVQKEWPTAPIDRKEYAVSTAGLDVQQTGTLRLMDKLEKIIIPELNFSEVDIADAVKFLEDQSRALDPDPEKTGINFVLKAEASPVSAPPAGASGTTAPPPPPAPARTLTLNLKNVPLIQILDYIKQLTSLQYKVDEHAVYIFPGNETSEVLVIKNFSVPPTFFPNTVKDTSATTGDLTTRTIEIATVPVKEELEKKGVKFPNGASAAYLPRTAKMVVKNTLDQLNLIDQLLSRETTQTKQIEVEAKFIDFADDKLKELSANLRFAGSGTIPSAFGVFPNNALAPTVAGSGPNFDVPFINNGGSTNASTALRTSNDIVANQLDSLLGLGSNRQANQIGVSGVIGGSGARLLITALESTLGADLMSAPKLTLVSGQKSKIKVSRELLYPTEYDPPEIVQSTAELSPPPIAVPSNPTSFESRDIGVNLEVKATATSDRRIDLELKPEVTEFQGFINYASGIVQSAQIGPAGDPVQTVVAEGVALTPVFAMRKVETKLQVIDGQTIIMGGFIREDKQMVDDKVPLLGDIPLLGRLFRSKVERSVKRNLVMLVTARIMKPDGTPEFLTEGERESYEITLIPSVQSQ